MGCVTVTVMKAVTIKRVFTIKEDKTSQDHLHISFVSLYFVINITITVCSYLSAIIHLS